jgi:monomeric isocitrate dehydrogenase
VNGDGTTTPYSFTPALRPFTAVGAGLQLNYSASNSLLASSKDDLKRVHTVPDPYYVTNQFEQTTDTKIIKFVNLPANCIIRIYSSSGVLVTLLEHHSATGGGAEDWNVRNRNNQVVASGVYFFHIEAGDARRVGRFTVVNFAE